MLRPEFFGPCLLRMTTKVAFLSPQTPESHPENTLQISRRVTRRESFPVSHYDRPLNPTIGVYPYTEPSQHLPTESSHLLVHPSVPRIEEIETAMPLLKKHLICSGRNSLY